MGNASGEGLTDGEETIGDRVSLQLTNPNPIKPRHNKHWTIPIKLGADLPPTNGRKHNDIPNFPIRNPLHGTT
jgi:hypothetical protein